MDHSISTPMAASSSVDLDMKERLTAEMAFITDSDDHASVVIKIRRRLPDFLNSVKLKYVKLGYNYSLFKLPTTFSPGFTLIFLPKLLLFLTAALILLIVVSPTASPLPFPAVNNTNLTALVILLLVLGLYRATRPSPVYLIDFVCHKPDSTHKTSLDAFLKLTSDCGHFTDETIEFHRKITARACLGDETYLPPGITTSHPPQLTMTQARHEAESVIFTTLDTLFAKTSIHPSQIDILIVNSSLFNPTPSLSSMIVNRYKLKSSIKSYNLGGMGCSAGLISIDLAKHLLKANPNSYALVFSTENITLNWYFGNDKSMLLCNCIFRMGGAGVLLSNKQSDRNRSKYELTHTVRTHKGQDDNSYNCVFQREDDDGIVGVSLARELMSVAGDALKTNITTLGPMVLPISEQVRFFTSLVRRKLGKRKVKPYIPDFKRAFEHFCIHAGGRAVLDEVEKNLKLREYDMEPSRMTLHRFGNTSSSSLWYELSYAEAKGRVKGGDRVWQIAFGSGFKCNSAVWKALKDVQSDDKTNPWADCVDRYPVKLGVKT